MLIAELSTMLAGAEYLLGGAVYVACRGFVRTECECLLRSFALNLSGYSMLMAGALPPGEGSESTATLGVCPRRLVPLQAVILGRESVPSCGALYA